MLRGGDLVTMKNGGVNRWVLLGNSSANAEAEEHVNISDQKLVNEA